MTTRRVTRLLPSHKQGYTVTHGEHNTHGVTMNDNDVTIGQHVQHCRTRGLRAETIRQRRTVLGLLHTALGKPLLIAEAGELETWQAQLAAAHPAYTTATYSSHVKAFYRWAFVTGRRKDNPSAGLLTVRIPKSLPRPIDEDDLRVALACATEPMRAWLVLGAYAGLRIGEIARLRREDVREHSIPPTIAVRDGKGGRDRIVPVGPHVIDSLRPHLRTSGLLWRTQNAGQFQPSYASSLVSKHFKSIGMAYTAHNLRHRYATELYRLSTDLRMVGDLLGHANTSTTAVYTAWSHEAAAESVAALDKRLTA